MRKKERVLMEPLIICLIEGVAVGMIGDRSYAFITLERFGGVVMYDVTDPAHVEWKDFLNTRSFSAENASEVGDLSPEGKTSRINYFI